MSGSLPELIKPVALSVAGTELEGTIAVQKMERFASLLSSNDGDIRVRLHFAQDASDRLLITGKAAGRVEVICQRCLRPMELELVANIALQIIEENRPGVGLAEDREPLEVERDPQPLSDIVENELILSMPITTLHAQCDGGEFADSQEVDVEKKRNPFAVLKDLKH